MPAKCVNVDRDTQMLQPQDLKEWIGENDLVHFVIEVGEQVNTSKAKVNERGAGSAQYPPSLMLALLM